MRRKRGWKCKGEIRSEGKKREHIGSVKGEKRKGREEKRSMMDGR